jgi:hypothetical protein
MAVGWQWRPRSKHPRFRDVLRVLHPGSGRHRLEQLVPRHTPERTTVFRMWRIGQWPTGEGDWQRLLDQVGAAGRNWARAEELMVEAIRAASALSPGTIGSHCMSVLVQPWRSPYALIRFRPASPHLASALYQTVETAHSPWMVASDAIYAPAMLVGGLSSDQGLLPYRMEAPTVPDSQTLKAAFRSHDRPAR